MAFVQSIGFSGTVLNSVQATLNGVAAGNFLAKLTAVWDNSSGNPPNSTPSDGVNTWNTTTAPTPQGGGNAFINYAENVAGGNTTVTTDYGDNTYVAGELAEFSDVLTSGSLDQQTSNGNAGSNMPTSGTTGTLAQADELVLAVAQGNDAQNPYGWDVPATTGYTNLFVAQDGNSGSGAGDYLIVSSTGAVSAAWGTLAGSYSWSAKIATFKLNAGVAITDQPDEQTAADGATAVFSITATGATSYQWQRLPPAGGSWANVSGGSGATTDTYTTPTLSRSSDAGAQYRCVVDGSLNSDAALLRVTAIPASYAGALGLVVGSAASFVGESHEGDADSSGPSITASLSAAVQVARAATASLSLGVQTSAQASASINLAAALARSGSAQIELAAQQARSTAASIDVLAQQARGATADLSLAAQLARSATAVVEALVQAPASQSASLQAAVQAAQQASASINAAVQVASSASASLQASVLAATQASASIDLQVLAGFNASASADVLVQQARQANATLDAALQLARSAAASLAAAVQAARSEAAGIDLAAQAARFSTANVNLAVAAARSATASIDAQVLVQPNVAAGLALAVRAAQQAGAVVELAVQTARQASASFGAAIALQRVIAVAMDAAVIAELSAAAAFSLYVEDLDAVNGPGNRRIGSTPLADAGDRLGRASLGENGKRIGSTPLRNTTRRIG